MIENPREGCRLAKRRARVGSALILGLALAVGTCTQSLRNWPRRALPDSVVIDAVLASDSDTGLREGCEGAVYRLSAATAARLGNDGIAYLAASAPPRNENPRNRYQGWEETPGTVDLATNGKASLKTIDGLNAMGGCGQGGGEDWNTRALQAALSEPGSYYTVTANREGIIIVAPRYRLAAYFYVG